MRFINTLCAIGCVMGLAGPSPAADAAAAPAAREMLKVDPRAHFKVVYDIHSAETAAGISKGLYSARRLIEAYGKQGVAIVHDGYTRLIKLQSDGYAYMGGF